MQMRLHQVAMDSLAKRIIGETTNKTSITVDCTPGGGKTGTATLLANRLLDAGVIDRVLWVVPRLALAEQVSDGFSRGFGSRQGRILAELDSTPFPDNLPNMPCIVGNVTTYQSIATGKTCARLCEAMRSLRVLVIWDEVQFLNDSAEAGWYPKCRQINEVAAFRCVLSGTLWRTDNRKIPFIEYERREDGKEYPCWDIQYTLRDAIAERAVLPTEWHTISGRVEYIYEGTTQLLDLLDDDGEEENRKLAAFLASEKAVDGLLDRMVSDWREWRRHKGYNSRMLVLARDTHEARRIRHYLSHAHNVHCTLATSKETGSLRWLKNFRERRQGECLVTVAMAYIGFDCPDLSHLAYLSEARAPSWMLQSFARVSRYDNHAPIPYEHQHAYVYSPDDERMRRFFDWLRAETDIGIRMQQARSGAGQRGEREPVFVPPDDFEPVDAEITGCAVESLAGRISPEHEARMQEWVREMPESGVLPRALLHRMLDKLGYFNSCFAMETEE